MILFLFAVTNKVTFGSTVLFEFDLPELFKGLTRPLRSSGRMVWLIFYLLYCGIFFVISRSKYLKIYYFILPILLVIQILDSSVIAANFRSKISDTRTYNLKPYIDSEDPANIAIVKTLNSFWESPLVSPEWKVLKQNYNSIHVIVRRIGGGFGGKETQSFLFAAITSIAAKKLSKPVKLRVDRDDDMIMTGKRHDFLFDYEVGFNNSGEILALKIMMASRCGISPDLSGAINDRAIYHIDNAYFLSLIHI